PLLVQGLVVCFIRQGDGAGGRFTGGEARAVPAHFHRRLGGRGHPRDRGIAGVWFSGAASGGGTDRRGFGAPSAGTVDRWSIARGGGRVLPLLRPVSAHRPADGGLCGRLLARRRPLSAGPPLEIANPFSERPGSGSQAPRPPDRSSS